MTEAQGWLLIAMIGFCYAAKNKTQDREGSITAAFVPWAQLVYHIAAISIAVGAWCKWTSMVVR